MRPLSMSAELLCCHRSSSRQATLVMTFSGFLASPLPVFAEATLSAVRPRTFLPHPSPGSDGPNRGKNKRSRGHFKESSVAPMAHWRGQKRRQPPLWPPVKQCVRSRWGGHLTLEGRDVLERRSSSARRTARPRGLSLVRFLSCTLLLCGII